jgi:hypothetical protein
MAALLLGGRFGESSGWGVSVSAEAAAVRNRATAVEVRNRSRRTLGIANSPKRAGVQCADSHFGRWEAPTLALVWN